MCLFLTLALPSGLQDTTEERNNTDLSSLPGSLPVQGAITPGKGAATQACTDPPDQMSRNTNLDQTVQFRAGISTIKPSFDFDEGINVSDLDNFELDGADREEQYQRASHTSKRGASALQGESPSSKDKGQCDEQVWWHRAQQYLVNRLSFGALPVDLGAFIFPNSWRTPT